MSLSWILSAVYLLQLGTKSVLARRYASIESRAARGQGGQEHSVTILQPILGGDPALASHLERNLRNHPNARFLWLTDQNDPLGARACAQAITSKPGANVQVIPCSPPSQGSNPKVEKILAALPLVTTPRFVVLDDDTVLSGPGLERLNDALDRGAALATGLPRYNTANTWASDWLAEFVNGSAALAYLPALLFIPPISIQGMCYALPTRLAREHGLFEKIRTHLTDDLALAQQLQSLGLRIHQTVEPHDISTSVPNGPALHAILHRWFVFTLLLLRSRPGFGLGFIVLYGVPPLLLAGLLVTPVWSWVNLFPVGFTLFVRAAIITATQRRILGRGRSHQIIPSIVLELAQPWFLLVATIRRTIRWRTRRIRVHGVDHFEYV